MTNELESAIVSKIKDAYEASINLADTAKENARAAIEKAVECGQYLIEAKHAAGHGRWIEWFRSHVTDFSIETAKRYMRLAEFIDAGGSLEDAQGMRQAFIAAGILLEPHRESGSQASHGASPTWLTVATRLVGEVNKLKEKAPVDDWDQGTRETMCEKLRPLAELHQRLCQILYESRTG